MKRLILLTTVVAMIAGRVFAMAAEEPPAPEPGATQGERFELILEPGPYYSKTVNYVVYRYTVWPQVAAWVETLDGEYLGTIYVTDVAVSQEFDAAPEEGRPEALPVWTHLTAPGGIDELDAVTSPTTVESTVTYGNSLAAELDPGAYVVMLETNRSYDWNDTYTRRNAGVNGQPSLVYRAEIRVGDADMTATFEPVGTGSVDGSDGRVRGDLSDIDTALKLFSDLRIRYHAR